MVFGRSGFTNAAPLGLGSLGVPCATEMLKKHPSKTPAGAE